MSSGRETDVLLAALNAERRHVLGIIEGLSDEDMRRPVLPTGWTAAGMVRHLTLDVEQFWFRGIVALAQPIELDRPDDADLDGGRRRVGRRSARPVSP